MAEITLTLKEPLKVPLDASSISPDTFSSKSLSEILSLEAWRGNRRVKLGDVFEASGDAGAKPEDVTIMLQGDLSKVRRVGMGMTAGKVVVEVSAGLYLGEGMKGGTIIIHGNAGPWVGLRMKGGTIETHGNVGDFVGSGYRGKNVGMKGGTIIVHGNAGNEVGLWMKGGIIRVKGSVGLLAGVHIQGGTIIVEGDSEGRVGAEMTEGKIVVLGSVPSILPSFTIDEVRPKAKVGEEKIPGPFYTFMGDVTESGKGKLFISVDKNPHLKYCLNYVV